MIPLWTNHPLRSLLLGLLFGINGAEAAGPPLDMSGEWQAIPNVFVPPGQGGGPYDTLSLQMTGIELGPRQPGITPYLFKYKGRYVRHERHFLSASAPPNCSGDNTLIDHPPYPVPYNVEFTTAWHVSRFTDDIVITSITGSAEVDAAALQSPHGIVQKGLLFGYTGTSGVPTDDAHARFNRQNGFFGGELPSDRCASFGTVSTRDHGGLEMWKVSAPPAQLNLTGSIKGQVKSLLPVTTTRSAHEVHRGQVLLYRQDKVVRPRRDGESDREYARFLAAQRTLVRPAVTLTPDLDGKFEFRNLPLLATRSEGPVSSWKAVRYTVQVTSAETDEIALDVPVIDTNKTEVLDFQPQEVPNLLPNSTVLVELRPSVAFRTKLDLVEALAELGPNNFASIEGRVRTFVNRLASAPEAATSAQQEGVRRAIWSERLARDGARYSNELLSSGLRAFASLIADAVGDLKRYEAEGIADARKNFQKIRDGGPNPRWSSQFNLTEVSNSGQLWQEMIQRGRGSEIANELIRLIKAGKLVLQEALIYAGMDGATARSVALYLEQANLFILNFAQNQTAQGAAKDVLKALLKEYLDDLLKPQLFDSSLPFSHTALVAPSLEYSEGRLINWNRSSEETYLADRAVVVDRISRLSNIANDALRLAIAFEAAAFASDTSQKVFGAAALIPPARLWATIAEGIAKKIKYISNASGAAESAIFVFWGAPKLVREGVYGAFGEQPPALRPYLPREEFSVSALAEKPPIDLPAANPISSAVRNLTGLISSNQIGAALANAASATDNSYAAAWDTWNRQVDVLELQASAVRLTPTTSASRALLRLQDAKTTLWLARSRFDTAFQELFRHVLTAPDAATNDPIFLSVQNEVRSMGAGLLAELGNFATTVQSFPSEFGRWERLPAVMIEILASSPAAEISVVPGEFSIQARISNLGYVEARNVQARLTILSSNQNVTVTGPFIKPAGSGNLARANDPSAAGGHQALVEWMLQYGPGENLAAVRFQVDLLENGAEPVSFASTPRSGLLRLAPEIYDQDLDGLPDSWERAHGLNPARPDAELDSDGDGLTNAEEFRLGLDPNLSDTDADGLSDSEELTRGTDGFVTNARNPDSDADGVPDRTDGHPTDEGSILRPTQLDRPILAVNQSRIVLTPQARVASVIVTNRGSGLLQWSASTANIELVSPSVVYPESSTGELLLLRLPQGLNLQNFGTARTTVRIHDEASGAADTVTIEVFVSGEFGAPLTLATEAGSGNVVLSWITLANKRYRVEYSEDLVHWKMPSDGLFPETPTGTLCTWTDKGRPSTDASPGELDQRFYRVTPL